MKCVLCGSGEIEDVFLGKVHGINTVIVEEGKTVGKDWEN